jgi:hypothetical protein
VPKGPSTNPEDKRLAMPESVVSGRTVEEVAAEAEANEDPRGG